MEEEEGADGEIDDYDHDHDRDHDHDHDHEHYQLHQDGFGQLGGAAHVPASLLAFRSSFVGRGIPIEEWNKTLLSLPPYHPFYKSPLYQFGKAQQSAKGMAEKK